jgi:5-methylcytosine-specific restriction endonuclease McrA
MNDREKRNKYLRKQRMIAACAKGTHTPEEWEALKAEFNNRCVRCRTDEYPVEKDHIQPVYAGGSDSIDNIQPLCARCNAHKGPEDFNWKEYRRVCGFGSTPDEVLNG